MLKLEKLHVAYLKKEILRGLSLEVGAGEIVALIGVNGAGKSTVLRTIAGILRPRTGKVWLDGEQVTGLAPHEIKHRGVGYLLQGGVVFPSLKVQENLEIAAHGVEDKGGPDGFEQAFSIFPRLRSLFSRRAGLLSGGERQMLAIAMVLIQQPRLALLDEPSAGVAPPLVSSILQRLQEHNRSRGTAMLLVEQNLRVAVAMAHRVYEISGGTAHPRAKESFVGDEDYLAVHGIASKRPSSSEPRT